MSCGCECENSIPTNWCNCNIIWQDNTTVTNNWNDIIVSSPFYNVVSPDDSTQVFSVYDEDTNTTTFEIYNQCCPDKLVGACDNDTNPWTLFNDKLRVDTTWPLTYNLRDCPWDAYVEIWFDASKLNTTDKKVAVDGSCPGKYLEEALTVNPLYSEYFEFAKTLCELRLTPKPQELFYADIHTNTALVFTDITANTQWRSYIEAGKRATQSTIPSWVQDDTTNDTKMVEIWRDWWYTVSMWWSCVVGKWIHTVRHQIFIEKSNWDTYPLLDDRFEWGWVKDWNWDKIIQLWELENVVSEVNQSDWVSLLWIETSLGRSLRWHWFWQTRTIFLNEWDIINFETKWNTVTRENNVPPMKYELWYTGRWVNWWADSLTLGSGSWVFWSVAEHPLWRLCD